MRKKTYLKNYSSLHNYFGLALYNLEKMCKSVIENKKTECNRNKKIRIVRIRLNISRKTIRNNGFAKKRITNLGDVEIKEVGVQNRLNNSGNDRDDIIEACKINNMHFYNFGIEINMKQEEKYNFVCLL